MTHADLASVLDRPIVALDVGCRWGVADRWMDLLPEDLRVYAFDADPDECRRLQAVAPDGVTYVPHGLGDRDAEAELQVMAEPACSSLFPPEPHVCERSPELRDAMRQVGRQPVALRALDGWAAEHGVAHADVMKLDVQGAELLVLQGAERLLRGVRLLEVEVMLNPLYVGQPLLGDIDAFLRERGFELWRLGQLVHYSADWQAGPRTYVEQHVVDSRPVAFEVGDAQVSWGHAYYCAPEFIHGNWATAADAARDALAAGMLDLDELASRARRFALGTTEPVVVGAPQVADAPSVDGPPAADPLADDPPADAGSPAVAQLAADLVSQRARAGELEAELGRVRDDRDELHAELHRVRDDRDRLAGAAGRSNGIVAAARRRVAAVRRPR